MAIIQKVQTGSIVDKYIVDTRTITALESINKQLVLPSSPSNISKVTLDIVGGTSQVIGDDFNVSGNILYWNGFSLETVLSENDKIRIIYPL